MIMVSSSHICIICKETREASDLFQRDGKGQRKHLNDEFALQSDHFFSISEEIRITEQIKGKYYYSKCFSKLCAVKKLSLGDSELYKHILKRLGQFVIVYTILQTEVATFQWFLLPIGD